MSASVFYRFIVILVIITLSAACAAPAPSTPRPTRAPDTQPTQEQSTPTTAAPSATPSPSLASDFNLILGRPTAHTIAASLYSQVNRQAVIAYGAGTGQSAQTPLIHLQAGVPQVIELTGLLPDTAYTYQILADGISAQTHAFHTPRAPGSSFTFTLDADPHNRDPRFDGALYATTLSNALNDHPDFHINLGDTFMTEKVRPHTYAEAESTFTDMRPYFGLLGGDAPLFLVNGNHEGELGWLLKGQDQNLPIWSTQLRRLYYPNPTPGEFYTGSAIQEPAIGARDGFYAWTWGDALFVVLDPFWYTTAKPRPDDPDSNWNWTLGKEQYDWLQSTLQASQARFKFVFIHHLVGGNKDARGGIEAVPFFEWGGSNADGSYGFDTHRPGWGKPIHQMLVENHVSVVFHGHDHVFVKQDLDGIVYQELPQPSNTEFNKTSLAAEYGYLHGEIWPSSGHLRVTVTPTQVIVDYVRAYRPQDEQPGRQNGQVDYSYRLAAR